MGSSAGCCEVACHVGMASGYSMRACMGHGRRPSVVACAIGASAIGCMRSRSVITQMYVSSSPLSLHITRSEAGRSGGAELELASGGGSCRPHARTIRGTCQRSTRTINRGSPRIYTLLWYSIQDAYIRYTLANVHHTYFMHVVSCVLCAIFLSVSNS